MDNIGIKRNIRRIRLAAGLPISEVALSMGISNTAYKQLETGDTKIIYDRLGTLAAALKTSQEEILLGYRPSTPEDKVLKDNKLEKIYENKLADHELQLKNLSDEYERRLGELQDTINEKDRLIHYLEDCIDTKNRNEQMRRLLDERENARRSDSTEASSSKETGDDPSEDD